jgi:naphthoate synthase
MKELGISSVNLTTGEKISIKTEVYAAIPKDSAQEAFDMGMVNAIIPHDELEDTAYEWAQEILAKSPTSIKMLKFAMNLTDDGMVGQQVFAGEATRLTYMTDEAKEGRDAFLEKRKPNFDKKWLP